AAEYFRSSLTALRKCLSASSRFLSFRTAQARGYSFLAFAVIRNWSAAMVELFVSVRGGSRQVVSFSAVFLLKSASFGLLLKLALSNVSVMGFGMLLTSDAGAPGVSGRCPCADAGEAEKSNTRTP